MTLKKPSVLITLLGSNPIVPVTVIKLFSDTPHVFILYTKANEPIFSRILQWKRNFQEKRDQRGKEQQILGIEVPPFDQGEILKELKMSLDPVFNHPQKPYVHFDSTGGTKPMLMATLFYLQRINADFVISYIRGKPWSLIITKVPSLETHEEEINLPFTVSEVISLHQDTKFDPTVPLKNEQRKVVDALIKLLSKQENDKRWLNFKSKQLRKAYKKKNRKVKPETELHGIEISFADIPELKQLIHPNNQKVRLADLTKQLQFRRIKKLVEWFDGFWLESRVADALSNLTRLGVIDDFKTNISSKDPEFELDMVFLVKNRVYVVSVSTVSDSKRGGKSELKKKIFEVMIRSTQIAGWKTYFGLVCLSDNKSALENEVRDYLVDRSVKVFGRKDLSNLEAEIQRWVKE